MNSRNMNWGGGIGVRGWGLVWALGLGWACAAPGQETNTPPRRWAVPVWECETPSGHFAVDVRQIASVAVHEYVVEGGVKAVELTVVMNGSAIARFYFVEPVRAQAPLGIGQSAVDRLQDKVKEGAERLAGKTGDDALQNQVIKRYPEATHAHTIEFRLKSREQVDTLFKSALEAWRQQRAEKVKAE